MDMERMGDAKLLKGARQRQDDLPRRDMVIDMLLVEIELALIELERADPARVDDLDGDCLGRVQVPRDIILDSFEVFLGRELAQEIIV